ncbi:carbohydrate ABC transporter permease [Metabacillus rhizolycopersici]|uniref:Carbohydrate ABC transporter permease n=1 Tax=Metabacillus rhizolycopersici TaxID=2875709 RepID=A0ABS7UZN6_9BACI|nr:carbohydrate ABC transporter permease [Metabacillus rhizolycopersici]MBZ5753596.1 carbohydrate ABC transporter permease [Metabacillus rhizolycopersici]
MIKKANIQNHLVLIIFSILSIFPMYWMVISSLKSESEIFSFSLFPSDLTFSNYSYAFETMPLVKMLLNSVTISILTTAGQLIIAILFAYAFTRWDFKFKGLIYLALSVTWLIPLQAIMVPNYVQINELGINGTVWGIIVPGLCSVFANIYLYQSFNAFPKALFDAARIDGISEWRILVDIVLPNMKPTIAALSIILIISSWNDYLWPMLVSRTLESSPIQIGLKSFVSNDSNLWGSLMAATTISCIPIFIAYIILQRSIMDTFLKKGIK